ncbi:MAG: NAD(P)H-dependent oxidoreductase subunit E, partial [Spirochaetota bacterium]|nr:NAD(P)H-dependent oxidoreductase subunit E [Spirochaetota bacterium]
MEANVKIKSIDELKKRQKASEKSRSDRNQKIHLCAGAGCIASGAMEMKAALEKAIEKAGLSIPIIETGCLGPCALGPVIIIKPEDVFYEGVKPEDADEIVETHFKKKTVVKQLTHRNVSTNNKVDTVDKVDFYRGQARIVLRNCGYIDPLNLDDFIAVGGYSSLAKVLTSMTPDQVVEEIKSSGLRGRGGAGFPTWLKWEFTKKAEGDVKYVLCNADEGDPGAFMDRSVLEGDPHSLIEGMAIAAFTIGANRGFVYVRAEYPLAVERFGKALEQSRFAGLLGEKILGTDFSFDLEIRMGSGAFVCGEETALIHSIEGKRGEPRPRPPFPAQKGLWGKPSLLNNVETYTNVAAIIGKGA